MKSHWLPSFRSGNCCGIRPKGHKAHTEGGHDVRQRRRAKMGHACAETSICAHGTAHATNVFFRPGRPSEPQAENDGRRPDAAGHTPDVEPYARPHPVVEARGSVDAMQTIAQPKAKTVFSVASVQPKLATGGRPAKPWQRQVRCGQRIKSKFTLDMQKDKGDKRKPHYVEQRECQCMAVEMIVSKSLWRGVQPRVLMLKAGSATSTAGKQFFVSCSSPSTAA